MDKDWWTLVSKEQLWINIPEALVAIDGRVLLDCVKLVTALLATN